ncbi:MAG TPA: acetate--CoA ligase family protein [Spirochaetota bacterium]|nr:acetate--CoA ligase family protein [Spirochaetota bacterium]HPR47795.1 acetate--CoA ligase family protein [Spirochaetota bacterium]
MNDIITSAIKKGQKALSEYDSKRIIQSLGIAITREDLALKEEDAVVFAEQYGYPVVLKGCSHTLTHKTEFGMVKLNLKNSAEVRKAYQEIVSAGLNLDGVLVQEMIKGDREFVMGLSRDPQFGPCVMFGMGGIYTEIMKDVSFRIAPITRDDAAEMLEEIRMKELLDEFRGSPAVERDTLINALVAIGNLGFNNDEIAEIDINPVIICGNKPVVVDALVILNTTSD